MLVPHSPQARPSSQASPSHWKWIKGKTSLSPQTKWGKLNKNIVHPATQNESLAVLSNLSLCKLIWLPSECMEDIVCSCHEKSQSSTKKVEVERFVRCWDSWRGFPHTRISIPQAVISCHKFPASPSCGGTDSGDKLGVAQTCKNWVIFVIDLESSDSRYLSWWVPCAWLNSEKWLVDCKAQGLICYIAPQCQVTEASASIIMCNNLSPIICCL